MASRLELVLRAGQAAETGPWGGGGGGLAWGLTDDDPGGKTNDPSTPGMHGARREADLLEEEEAEAKWQLAVALQGRQRASVERAQREAATREQMKEFTARIHEDERQEKRRVDAYNRGKANMWHTIFKAQMPLMDEMQEALAHIQGTRYEDNEKLNDLAAQMVMLKSAFDLEGPDYYWRPPEAALFDHP